MTRRKITKIALAVSIILLAVWLILGATSSITWFKEEDTLVNSLHFGDIDITMYHKNAGSYEVVDESTKVFDESALYEPGYTQLSYLKIENTGSIPFTYDLSVVPDLASTVLGTSVLGNSINLADYLQFGLILADTEEEVLQKTADRETAIESAIHPLSNYSEDGGTLYPGEADYAALIIYLPTDVDNVANYRGDTAPEVALGISAIANQIN